MGKAYLKLGVLNLKAKIQNLKFMRLSKATFLPLIFCCFLPSSIASAQIIPDSTLPVNSSVDSGCTVCTIEGGTTRGVNLFHSFSEFSVPRNSQAIFNNNLSIENIFTRVTGTNISNIDGLIRTNGSASLFLLNPNGIIFGENARLEIGGSFAASTSDSFQFFDGSEFSAVDPQAPPLLTINISPGLQYGRPQANRNIVSSGILSAGKDLVLVGDNLNLNRIENLSRSSGAVIRASSDVSLNSYQGASLHVFAGGSVDIGSVNITGADINNNIQEDVTLSDGTNVSINGAEVPTLDVRAGTTDFDTAGLTSNSISGTNNNLASTSANIRIGQIRNQSGMTSNTGKILLTNQYKPNVLLGNIQVGDIFTYGDVNIDSRSVIDTTGDIETYVNDDVIGNRTGGNIRIVANDKITIGGNIYSDVLGSPTLPKGNGGNIFLISKNGEIDASNSEILSDTPNGIAGDVTIEAAGNINVGNIKASSNNDETDAYNQVSIVSNQGSVYLDNSKLETSNSGSLLAGDIIINAREEVSIKNQSNIGSRGNSGRILIGKSKDSSQTTSPFSVNINSSVLSTVNSGIIGTNSQAINAGDISIDTGKLTINNSNILSNTVRKGNAGFININAGTSVEVIGNSQISTSVVSGNGEGGNIRVTAPSLSLINGASISSNLEINSNGDGGDIELNISGDVLISGVRDITNSASGVFTTAERNSFGNGGEIKVTANTLRIADRGTISAQTDNSGEGGIISLTTNNLVIEDNAKINATTSSSGIAGIIDIKTNALNLNRQGQILASTSGDGEGGNISIQARSLSLDSSLISAGTFGRGNAGRIGIDVADKLAMSNLSLIGGEVGSPVGASGEEINIKAQNLYVESASKITTSLVPLARGNAGNININVADAMLLDGTNSTIQSSVSNGAIGNSGSLNLTVGSLSLNNGALLSTQVNGIGNGGNIIINARDRVSVNGTSANIFPSQITSALGDNLNFAIGNGGDIIISTRELFVTNGGSLNASATGSGDAGNIEINAENGLVRVTDSGSRFLTQTNSNIGVGGGIFVNTGSFEIANSAQLNATTTASAPGGIISIKTNSFSANSGAELRTSTSGSGNAGNIDIDAINSFTLADSNTGLFADTSSQSTGNGGDILITSKNVLLNNSGRINVGSRGTGMGGIIEIEALELTLNNGAFLSAETASSQGGDIFLKVEDLLWLRGNSLISTTAGTAQSGGNGGNISITAPFILSVLRENSDIRANAFTGDGGKVDITADAIIGLLFQPQETANSDITASSKFGASGEVSINTPNVDPSQGLAELPTGLSDPSNQIAQGCSSRTRTAGEANKFTITGRDGLPPTPNDPFTGRNTLVDLYNPVANNISSQEFPQSSYSVADNQKPDSELVEARGWEVGNDGRVYLVANTSGVSGGISGFQAMVCPP